MSIAETRQILKFVIKKKYREYINRVLRTTDYHVEQDNQMDEDPAILIIQRENEMVGTFSDYIVFLHYIERAIERGMVPVIDRQTNKNFFLNGAEEENTWEFFFEQPCNISLSEINSGTLVKRCYTSDMCSVSLLHCHNPEIINYWRKIAKKYIRLNCQTSQHVNKWIDKLLHGKRVLGVAIREGYDIWFEETSVGKNHAYQMDARSLIKEAEIKMAAWNCNYIFVTCQTNDTVKQFEDVFEEKLILYPRKREIIEGYKAHSQRTIEEEKKNELDYITEINLLASCTCLLCSENSGTEAAFIISEGYENYTCYNVGFKN